jgi:hypothetical protein
MSILNVLRAEVYHYESEFSDEIHNFLNHIEGKFGHDIAEAKSVEQSAVAAIETAVPTATATTSDTAATETGTEQAAAAESEPK